MTPTTTNPSHSGNCDPSAVTEALDFYEECGEPINANVAAAARSWVEGKAIHYCEYHEARSGKRYCRYGFINDDRDDCRIISKRLCDGIDGGKE